jgi:hypothetical protein
MVEYEQYCPTMSTLKFIINEVVTPQKRKTDTKLTPIKQTSNPVLAHSVSRLPTRLSPSPVLDDSPAAKTARCPELPSLMHLSSSPPISSPMTGHRLMSASSLLPLDEGHDYSPLASRQLRVVDLESSPVRFRQQPRRLLFVDQRERRPKRALSDPLDFGSSPRSPARKVRLVVNNYGRAEIVVPPCSSNIADISSPPMLTSSWSNDNSDSDSDSGSSHYGVSGTSKVSTDAVTAFATTIARSRAKRSLLRNTVQPSFLVDSQLYQNSRKDGFTVPSSEEENIFVDYSNPPYTDASTPPAFVMDDLVGGFGTGMTPYLPTRVQ